MRLIDQHVKSLMEECKSRARDFGLSFDEETLEYIVSNQDMNDLSPKVFIPTHYDFWLHDVETHFGKGQYKLYPHNPYETVINTRPSISFYNNDNPDWMNKAIFYHVLGHQDFFQNNEFFAHTWKDDLTGRALSHKRRINEIRKEQGENKRHVDYVIEFTRQIDNLININKKLRKEESTEQKKEKLDYYFTDFLKEKNLSSHEYLREIESYNKLVRKYGEDTAKVSFIKEINKEYPEFGSFYNRYLEKSEEKEDDLIDFIINNSPVVNKHGNEWMKEVMTIVKEMSEFLAPQMFTKICNEAHATYIHNELFMNDRHLSGHEVDFARWNAGVTQTPKIGMNPYALGYKLLEFIRDLGDKGKLDYGFQKMKDFTKREEFNLEKGKGMEVLFEIRKNFNDFLFLNFLDEKNFEDFVYQNKLYVAERRLNMEEMKWEFYIKSRKGEDYRNMVIDKLPHHPTINYEVNQQGFLFLDHVFEGKQLHTPFIPNVLRGLYYLWGNTVILDSTKFELKNEIDIYKWLQGEEIDYQKERIRYRMRHLEGSPDKTIM